MRKKNGVRGQGFGGLICCVERQDRVSDYRCSQRPSLPCPRKWKRLTANTNSTSRIFRSQMWNRFL